MRIGTRTCSGWKNENKEKKECETNDDLLKRIKDLEEARQICLDAGIDVESRNLAEGYTVSALTENDRTITVIAKGVTNALENLDLDECCKKVY